MTTPEIDDLMSRAIASHRAGRVSDAITLYRDVLGRDPKLVQAHSNLGLAHSALGQVDEAERCHRRVIKLLPRDPLGHTNLGRVLQHKGRTEEAIGHFALAYLEAPDEPGHRARLVEALAHQRELPINALLRRALTALSKDGAVRHQRLVPAVAGLLKRQPAVARALRRIAAHGALSPQDLGPGVYRSLTDSLVMRLLSDCVFSDADVEALLTALRRVWLAAIVEGTSVRWPSHELLAAAALQALTTEWVYGESSDERVWLDRVAATLAEPEARVTAGTPSRALQVYALYRPLGPFAEDAMLVAAAENEDHAWSEVFRRHLIDPLRERSLAASLPRLTSIVDDVSKRVRSQYEERPYPRWRTFERRNPLPLGEVLAATLREPDLARTVSLPTPQVLVAGCGTGRHAIATATRFAGAQVLAIDLSLTSLGFAARQAEDLDVRNVSFAQADILGLGDLPDRFDVIESSGVLHHMENPETGWRALRGLLLPGGLMRIGLYSERGRTVIDSIRELIRERRLEPTVDGIRAARATVRALPENHPGRRIVSSPDFHAVSGCRDVFFPAHEDRFDLTRIGDALGRLDLEFLGFELPDERVRQLYRQRFPWDRAARDLANWDRLEAEMPTLFAAMYQFWCRAPV